MKYRILRNRDPEELAQMVNNAMNEGWIPLGGLCYGSLNPNLAPFCLQAMTMEDRTGWVDVAPTKTVELDSGMM